jgi:hypothetical protein
MCTEYQISLYNGLRNHVISVAKPKITAEWEAFLFCIQEVLQTEVSPCFLFWTRHILG